MRPKVEFTSSAQRRPATGPACREQNDDAFVLKSLRIPWSLSFIPGFVDFGDSVPSCVGGHNVTRQRGRIARFQCVFLRETMVFDGGEKVTNRVWNRVSTVNSVPGVRQIFGNGYS